MTIRRRHFLGLMGSAAAVAGLPALSAAAARGRSAADLTTLARTLAPGPPIREGLLGAYRSIVDGPGEPHLVRDDLVGGARRRKARRQSLVGFVHLTDQHLIDVQSTTRVEFLDRYSDGDCGDVAPFTSAHRPHEAASLRIGDAMLRQLRAIGASPVSAEPLHGAICTGDNTDNQQGNELEFFLALMDGGTVTPQSGDAERYEGVQRSGDRAYWHPDPDGTATPDKYKELFGYPDAPGWLEAALAPFESGGAGVPWFSCYGNHDGLPQGTSPMVPAYQLIAESGLKVVGTPDSAACLSLADPSLIVGQLTVPGAPAMLVTADALRQYVTRRQWIQAHLESAGAPHGHGFTQHNADANVAYYQQDVGEVRWIVLDTVNPGGLESGSIGEVQLAWLDERLAEADDERKLVLLFSHHGPRSLDNPINAPGLFVDPDGNDLPRHNTDAVLEVVTRHPSVIAWVNGHTHDNIITPRPGPFWDIGTAAHIDWPSQSRLIDVFDNRDGTLSIFTTMVDHADDEIASLARELMGNDPQMGFGTGTGDVTDRNTELLLPHPFAS